MSDDSGRVNFLKTGDVFLNLDRVTMVRVQRDHASREPTGCLLVYFHENKRAKLKGVEADSLRHYLESQSTDAGPEGGPEVFVDSGNP